jgi:hypothetical protein
MSFRTDTRMIRLTLNWKIGRFKYDKEKKERALKDELKRM